MTHSLDTPPETPPISRTDALALDAADTLAPLRAQFSLPPGTLYLDGNSLGALPSATAARVADVVAREWGQDLITSWNRAGWISLPQRVGDQIARLVGAAPGEVVVADSTSVNLYKVLHAALALVRARGDASRRSIVSERSNFPTDLYIAQSLAEQFGCTLELLDAPEIAPRLAGARGASVAVLMLTQVNYRSGALHDMAALTAAAHAAGALALWDLAHSAGALPVDLNGAGADFAVGCGYKYLNGGPGAPAFAWAHARHAAQLRQPLTGWMGHAHPFTFETDYAPAPGMARFLCGTPAVLAMSALECGVQTVLAAEPLGGMAALRAKSLQLSRLFMDLTAPLAASHGLACVTPTSDAARGSQVSLACPAEVDGYAVMQALIARGVVGDFRAGSAAGAGGDAHLLRFGFTPLYTGFADVWDAARVLADVLHSGQWREARFAAKAAVT